MSEYTNRLRPRLSRTVIPKTVTSPDINKTKKTLHKPQTTKQKGSNVVSRVTRASIKSLRSDLKPIPAHNQDALTLTADSTTQQSVPFLSRGKKEKRRHTKSKKEVNELLSDAGVEDLDQVCDCLKAGVRNGFINLEKKNPLDQVLLTDTCPDCDSEDVIKVTLRDVLYQDNKGDFYYSFDSALECSRCERQLVVRSMCRGTPALDTGRFYNHCALCRGFGRCIGDWRNDHCDSCGRHFFAGSTGQLVCSLCYSTDEDSSFLGGSRPASPKDSVISYIYGEQDFQMASQLNRLAQTIEFPNISRVMAESVSSNE